MSPEVLANLRVPGADGTALATDVYTAGDPAPVVVLRTCYGRSAHLAEGLGWARRGFAFVAQDVRGRYDSDGVWTPYQCERGDGRALAEWIAEQPWCDGRIVPIGASYAAYTAYAMAVSAPVTALVSQVPAMGLHRVKFDPSGILRLAEHVNWWLAHAESRTSRPDLVAKQPSVIDGLPVSGLEERFWARLPGWWSSVEPWVDGPADPPAEVITDAEIAALPVPSLHLGGWDDLLVPETLHHWRTARDASVLIGPWGHEMPPMGGVLLEWLDAVLRDGRRPWTSRLRLVGEERWRQDVEWPSRTEFSCGQGRFTYDPLDPYSSFVDDRERRDVVRLPVLDRPVTLLGAPEVVLDGEIEGAGADWVARLIVRGPDGSVRSLSSGAVQTGPGRHQYRITLTPIGATLEAGAVLEMEIAGSDFPFLARNLGTGADRYRTVETARVEQIVHAASVGLPVVEES